MSFSQPLDGVDQLSNIVDGETDIYSPREHIVHNIRPSSVCSSNSGLCGGIRWRNYKLVVGNEVSTTEMCWSTWCVLMSASFESTEVIQCTERGNYDFPMVDFTNDCPFNGEPCLFDLDEDPCEYTDIKDNETEIFDLMWDLMLEYNESAVPALHLLFPDQDDAANPINFGGFWSPWVTLKDDETFSLSDFISDDDDDDEIAVDMKVVERIKKTEGGHDWDASIVGVVSLFVIIGLGVIKIYEMWKKRGNYKVIEDESVDDRKEQTIVY